MVNKLPDVPTKETIVKLFENIESPKIAIGCYLGLVCGLRVSEVCKLEVADIDLQNRQIKIRDAKNTKRTQQGYGKDRIVPVPVCAISPIQKWLSIIEGSKWFMPSDKNSNNHIRARVLERGFFETKARAGLNDVSLVVSFKKHKKGIKEKKLFKLRFHSLRHFYATKCYEKLKDIYAVANLLGHSRLDTTKIYAQLSTKVQRENIDLVFGNEVSQVPVQRAVSVASVQGKSPEQILQERYAKGEISDLEFQKKVRLLRIGKAYLENGGNAKNEPISEVALD